MKYSIVTTLYKSERYIEEFIQRIRATLESLDITDYEFIIVNDGSPDNALSLVKDIANEDDKIKVIDLSRNFGHYKAIMTGLEYTSGDEIFLIDCDLEEEPELLIDFIQRKKEVNCDVVYGVQYYRKGSLFEKLSGSVFYKISNYLCDGQIVENAITARLMSKQYVEALLKYQERNLMIFGLFTLVGFKQEPLVVTKHSISETTYTLTKKLALVSDAVTSFSTLPLKLISRLGFLISLLSFTYILYITFLYYSSDNIVLGWSSVIASIWLVGGFILMSLGVIGMYISRIYLETKSRPLTIVSETINIEK